MNILTQKTYTIDGTSLSYSYVYNSYGQMTAQTFPDGMTENYTYDSYGNLATIKIGGQRVWELSSYNGTSRTIKLGEAPLTLSKSYSPSSGALSSTTISNSNGPLHIFSYTFDGSGNLTNRYGMTGSSNETFNYDQFDRLTTGTSYYLNGNINSKTGIGNYTYDTNKKHAIIQVQNSGNLIPKENVDVTYNAFNKVATVTKGSTKLSITYGTDHQRTKTVLVNNGVTTTTLYTDNYEQRTASGVTTTYHYVASPDGLAAVYVKKNGTTTAYYVVTDHIGSIVRMYDYVGNVKYSAAYDAWGNQTISKNDVGITRGYTGHEHWNVFGLIDMNGRFYDPLLGRFLSPDPYVQAPANPQNFNRYSYCLNNPLKYTDPSGEFFWIPFAIGAAIGAYTGYKIADANGYDLGSWQTYGYMVGGAFIGGMSGVAGAEIAAFGGSMANTIGIVAASHINSTGMLCLSSGQTDYTLSFGAVSYNFSQGEWGYLGKKGNSKLENVGYGLGTLANVADILAGFNPGDVNLRTENDPNYSKPQAVFDENGNFIGYEDVPCKDLIGHSQIVDNNGKPLVDWGPTESVSGFGDWVPGTNSYEGCVSISASKMKWDAVNIRGVNVSRISNWNPSGKYNLALNSCVSQASRALNASGAFNVGIHPYLLHAQMYLRSIGVRPCLFSYMYQY